MALAMITMATKGQAASKLDYYNLWEYLFGVYNKDVRPVNDDEKTTVVYAAFSLFSIVEVSSKLFEIILVMLSHLDLMLLVLLLSSRC